MSEVVIITGASAGLGHAIVALWIAKRKPWSALVSAFALGAAVGAAGEHAR